MVHFHILGPLKVTAGGEPIAIRPERVRAVLAALLLHSPHVVPVDGIIDDVWTAPPHSAIENVRTYIWQLRSIFRQAGEDFRLERHSGGYRMLADHEELDLLRFTRFAADGRYAVKRGNLECAAMLLRQALELWYGDALIDLEQGTTMRAKTAALEEQRRRVESDWFSVRMALGEYQDLVAPLRRLTLERPLDEEIWHFLITALYSLGRTAEALSAYAEARRTLIAELGMEPGPELQAVHAAVLRREEIVKIGPRPVFGITQCAQVTPHQLPVSHSGFVGHEDELTAISKVTSGTHRWSARSGGVILISGPPGVGKSATAIAAAHNIQSEFPDGQIYIDLHGSSHSSLSVADALAWALDGFGLQPAAMPEDVTRRSALYRSLLAERRMLIVLDNASTASQIVPLIPGQGQSALIVTSLSELVGIDAALRLRLEPLTEDEAVEMLARIAGAERVAREREAAVAIVNACAGLPLAIRIVGALLIGCPDQSLWILGERLSRGDNVLDELSVDGMAVRERLDASYRALSPSLRRSFRLTGKLTPHRITAAALAGFTREPVQSAHRELESLVREGLLMPGVPEHLLGSPGQHEVRYRMLSLLHLYARERLAGADVGEAC